MVGGTKAIPYDKTVVTRAAMGKAKCKRNLGLDL